MWGVTCIVTQYGLQGHDVPGAATLLFTCQWFCIDNKIKETWEEVQEYSLICGGGPFVVDLSLGSLALTGNCSRHCQTRPRDLQIGTSWLSSAQESVREGYSYTSGKFTFLLITLGELNWLYFWKVSSKRNQCLWNWIILRTVHLYISRQNVVLT